MPPQPKLDFANQDLRNRSFKDQNLSGANFSGTDIRGCNFNRAVLVDASFVQAKAGQTRRQRILLLLLASGVGLFVVDAVGRLVFSAQGQTPAEPAWSYVLTLYGFLGVAATGMGIRALMGCGQRLNEWLGLLAFGISGALVGFYYGGSLTDNNSRSAIATAIVLGVLATIVHFTFRTSAIKVTTAMAGAVTAYGFTFVLWAWAIACLSTHHLLWGIVLTLLTLFYLWLTAKILMLVIQEILHACGTSFRKATLTNAQFDDARLENVDFGGAIDPPVIQ